MADGMTAQDLAADLGMLQPDDVQALLSDHLGLDLHDDVIPAAVCVQVLGVLDRTRDRVSDLEQHLREIRGEKCAHWVDGPGGERIATPTFSCRHCA